RVAPVPIAHEGAATVKRATSVVIASGSRPVRAITSKVCCRSPSCQGSRGSFSSAMRSALIIVWRPPIGLSEKRGGDAAVDWDDRSCCERQIAADQSEHRIGDVLRKDLP